MQLTFHGGAHSVPGALYLAEIGPTKLLIDCGLAQGGEFYERVNFEPFPFEAKNIDAVVLTHAHLDHIGRLPKLFKDGFRGPVYATLPPLELARLNWEDGLRIDQSEHKTNAPLYGQAEIE